MSITSERAKWRRVGLLVAALGGAACGRSTADAPTDAAAGDAAAGDAVVEAGPEEETGSPPPPPPFTIAALTRAGIGSYGSTGWPNVGSVRADVDWMNGPFAQVTLIVDLESACFPFAKWTADPPPVGQSWPADCDAFDRNFNVVIDGTLEVIHAITPFGGPEHLEVDLTDLANGLPGKHGLRVDLPSYPDPQGMVTGSNGGWTVSARIEATPGPAPRNVIAVIPLFVETIAAGDAFPVVSWEVPAAAVGGRIEYRTSGHGQGAMGPRCVGPAEEFCDRRHLIFIDGAQVDNIEPYREDCQTLCTLKHYGAVNAGFDYCLENPGGLPDSVRAPRANWCPGSMTPPFVWQDLPALSAPGPHTFSFEIPGIIAGGTWLASAIYTAYGP